ncbi:MAG: hypothetical protein GY869_29250 [Planctomycetes bacterium]|nr:hypothetical protein [Planctomycetota bacterium]
MDFIGNSLPTMFTIEPFYMLFAEQLLDVFCADSLATTEGQRLMFNGDMAGINGNSAFI